MSKKVQSPMAQALKRPWIIELPQEGGINARVLDPITKELVFEGPGVHCLAWIRTATVPEITLERAKHALTTGVQSLLKELSDDLVLKGMAAQDSATRLLSNFLVEWMEDEGLLGPAEVTH